MDPMTRIRTAGIAVVLLALTAVPARADISAFIGANPTPANRQFRGAALGFGLLTVAVGLEYADTPGDLSATAPSTKTGMGNLIIQTPASVMAIKP